MLNIIDNIMKIDIIDATIRLILLFIYLTYLHIYRSRPVVKPSAHIVTL